MDSLNQVSHNLTYSPLASLLNYLVIQFFKEFHSTCIVKTKNESFYKQVITPSIIITVQDQDFNTTLRQGIDNGCQAFIIYGTAVKPFLDSFLPVHDSADQRYSGRKLICVISSEDFVTFELLFLHTAIKDIPDILIILEDKVHSMQLYTTHIFGDGSRGSTIVEPRVIVPPDYFPDKSRNLNAIPMRYRAVMYPPYTYYEETSPGLANAQYDIDYSVEDVPVMLDGHESLVLVEFCQKYNCSIQVYPEYSLDDWGTAFQNGTATGAIGAVANRHADFLVGALYFWVEPYKLLTYTFQLSRSGVNVLVPKPQLLPSWQIPLLTFTSHLWTAVSVVFCIGVVSVWLVERIRFRIFAQSNESPRTFSDSVLTIIGFFMEQNASMHNDLVACILLYSSLLFAGYMVSNMYGAGLAGVMTVPQYGNSINTPEDLADSGMLWGAETVAWVNSFTLATEPYMQTLVKNFRVLDLGHLTQLAQTSDFGFVGEHSEFGHFVPTDFLDAETSLQKRLLAKDLLWQSCTAYVSKTCPFKSRLNDLIMNMRQSGIQHYWELRAVHRYLDTNLQVNILREHVSGTDSEAEILTVSHFLGAFLILTLGYVTGWFVLIAELLFWNFKINKRTTSVHD